MREFRFGGADEHLVAFDEGDGSVLLFVHGFMADHRAAWPMVAPLAARYHVVAPDVRGNGRSWFGGQITFEQFSHDLERLLDHLAANRAVVGGVSGGSGVALHFALANPGRVSALVLVKPVYAGSAEGYTDPQKQIFAGMDAIASRAVAEGVQVLQPLYAALPSAIREKALAMIKEFDAPSVVATSRFVASGAQPFASAVDLGSLRMPVLVIRGDDPMHPATVSDLYAQHIPRCTVLSADVDIARSIDAFLARL